MHSFSLLPALLLPLASALTLPSLQERDGPSFSIPTFTASFPVGPPYGTSSSFAPSLQFTVDYPNSAANGPRTLSTTCRYTWPAGSQGGPTTWTACDATAIDFQFPASGYVGLGNFVLEIRENSSPKLDGSVKITSNNQQDPNAYLTCIQMGKFQPSSCNLNGPLSGGKAPIVIPTTVVPAA